MATTAPTKLGRYEIVEEIGKGAMGVVYLAKDPLIGRLVALKTFRIGYSVKDEELHQFRERFIREAQSAGILSHPNIVTIHDVVVSSEEGVTFIAMEYVRGTNLKELLQGAAPMEMAFAVDVAAQVADALDFAHTKGVIHRDVKPANILITGDRRVKITDFGIARLNTSNLTFDGQLLGTPNYMAPEQIQGKEVDHRADIFSLGVVLYELLTRKKPFSGENLTVVTHRIVYEPFAPPDELVPGLSDGLKDVLTRSLEKDPERRFARASQMAEDLRRSLQPNLNDTLATFVSSRTERIATVPAVPKAPPPASPPSPRSDTASEPDPIAAADAVATARTTVIPRAGAGSAPPASAATPAGSPGTGPAPLPAPALAAPPPLPEVAPPAKTTATKPKKTAAPPAAKAAASGPATPAQNRARWIVLGLGGLALLCVVAIGVVFWRQRTPPPPPPILPAPAVSTPAGGENVAATALLEEGKRLLATGDPAGAVRAFAEAERMAPGSSEARGLRLAAEARVQADAQLAARAEAMDAALARGREAMSRRRYEDAKAAAAEVLALVPNHPEAAQLQAQAEDALARRRERASAPPPVAPPPVETAATEEVRTPAPPAPPPRTDATLALDFHTEVPRGSVTVYLNDRQLLRQSFKFVRRSNVFRTESQPGGLAENRTVAAGDAKLRVIVALDGKPTKVVQIAGNFPGGSVRTLVVRVDAEGNVTGTLQ